jgi:hypothetical protein
MSVKEWGEQFLADAIVGDGGKSKEEKEKEEKKKAEYEEKAKEGTQGDGNSNGTTESAQQGETDISNGPCPAGVDCNWLADVAKNGLNAAGYWAGGLGGIQIGMLEYRQALSATSKIGTFPRFRIGYGRLGFASRGLGALSTYVGAPLTTYLDYRSMQAGEIGPARFTFRLGATAASIAGSTLIGAEVGGPYGALTGAAISGASWAGEISYDGLKWFGREVSRGMIETENALKNGWYPGR